MLFDWSTPGCFRTRRILICIFTRARSTAAPSILRAEAPRNSKTTGELKKGKQRVTRRLVTLIKYYRPGRIFTSANCSSETIQFALMDLNVLWNVTKARVCLSSPRHVSRSCRNEGIMSLDMGLLSDLQILEERLFNEKSAASPVQLKRKVVEVGDPAHEIGTWLKIPDIAYGNLVALGTDGVEIASIASRVFAQETDTEQAKALALKMAAVHTGTKQSWLAELLGLPHCPRPVRGNDERVLCKVLERKHCRGDLPAAETKQVRARACDAHTPHRRC